MSMLPTIFRLIQEAPHLLDEVEAFWAKVTANAGVHPTVLAGVQAAFTKMREGEVG